MATIDPAEGWATGRRASPPGTWRPASARPDFAPQFDACDRLEAQVMTSLGDPDGRFNQNAHAMVKLAVARALHAFDALLILADRGYGTPALAIARTMIEETVAAWWLQDLRTEELLERLTAHEQSYALMLQAEDSAVNYLPILSGLPQLSSDDVEFARRTHDVDTNLGARHWTRKSIKAMAQAVGDSMRPIERSTLELLVGKPLLVANLMTHNSPMSMATGLVPPDELDPSVVSGARTSRRPATRLVHEALAVGYESMSLLAWLVADSDETPDLDSLVIEDRHAFVVIPAGSKSGRNDPCPCDSGKKYKLCHGRPGMGRAVQLWPRGWQRRQ